MNLVTKFIYLYFFSEYRKTEYRNMIAEVVKQLKTENLEGCNDELIASEIKFYRWLCENQ